MRFLMLLSVLLLPVLAFSADVERVSILVQLKDNGLHFESSSLNAPLHHAGYYVKWTNEEDFIARHKLASDVKYRIEAKLVRSEVQKFPEGRKERSGKFFTTFYLEALSIERAENKRMDLTR